MLGPHRGTIEREEPTAFEHAIENGLREIVVMEDPPPGTERFIGREDHRALLAMAIIDDVKEHVGRVGTVGEIADLVDDQHGRVRVGGEDLGEASLAEGRRELINEFGSGDEAGIEAMLDRAVREGNGEMRFATPWLAGQNHTAAFGHEIRCEH